MKRLQIFLTHMSHSYLHDEHIRPVGKFPTDLLVQVDAQILVGNHRYPLCLLGAPTDSLDQRVIRVSDLLLLSLQQNIHSISAREVPAFDGDMSCQQRKDNQSQREVGSHRQTAVVR